MLRSVLSLKFKLLIVFSNFLPSRLIYFVAAWERNDNSFSSCTSLLAAEPINLLSKTFPRVLSQALIIFPTTFELGAEVWRETSIPKSTPFSRSNNSSILTKYPWLKSAGLTGTTSPSILSANFWAPLGILPSFFWKGKPFLFVPKRNDIPFPSATS